MNKLNKMDKQMNKQVDKMNKQIDKLVDSAKDAPAQKSPEWYAIKQHTIGGSEIAAIIGKSSFNNLSKLIASRIGINVFNGNICTRWGNLFEKLTQMWCETTMDIIDGIKELGSLEGALPGQRYSPDGIGVVRLLNINDKFILYKILFEFKAPYGTLPNNKIPDMYIPQVQTGLMTIPLVDAAIFVNNCYRKCSLDDIDFTGVYDKLFHKPDYKKRIHGLGNEIPYACGVICFWQSEQNRKNAYDYFECPLESDIKSSENDFEYDISDVKILFDNNIDFGKSNIDIFDRLLKLYDEGRVFAEYSPIIVNYDKANKMDFLDVHKFNKSQTDNSPKETIKTIIDNFNSECKIKNRCLVGYLPWKLMRSNIISEERDVEWKFKIEKPLENAIMILNKITNAEDPHAEYYKEFASGLMNSDDNDDYINDMSDILSYL
jgi:hypothetical protein